MENIIHTAEESVQFLNEMALFVEVVNAKSFSKAAEKVGMPNSTLSVRISKLEEHIGLRLLNRTTRKLELTEAGEIYYQQARQIVEDAKLAHQRLNNMLDNPSGLLRVSVPVEFAQIFIAPLMAEFHARFPLIQFDFYLTPHKVDLISEPFDLAIRIGQQENSTLISRLLAQVGGGVYAAPSYLAQNGEPKTPDELSQHQCLRFRHGFGEIWRLYNGKEAINVPIQSAFQTNSPGMNRELALSGVGITLLPELVVRDCVKRGKLKRILPDWVCDTVPIYAMTATRLLPKKTQVFIEFLKEKLARYEE